MYIKLFTAASLENKVKFNYDNRSKLKLNSFPAISNLMFYRLSVFRSKARLYWCFSVSLEVCWMHAYSRTFLCKFYRLLGGHGGFWLNNTIICSIQNLVCFGSFIAQRMQEVQTFQVMIVIMRLGNIHKVCLVLEKSEPH